MHVLNYSLKPTQICCMTNVGGWVLSESSLYAKEWRETKKNDKEYI